MGNSHFVQCRCGLGIATYRCSYDLSEGYVRTSAATAPSNVRGLTKYWTGEYRPGIARYIACERCVGKYQEHFTGYPQGWIEKKDKPVRYENIHL